MRKRKSTDRHHLVWYRRDYNKGWAKKLRDYWYCSIEIPRDTLHHQIHYEIAHIPVPRAIAIKEAWKQLELLEEYKGISKDDDITKRLMVLCALFDSIEPETYMALRKQYEIACEFYNIDPRWNLRGLFFSAIICLWWRIQSWWAGEPHKLE